LIILGLHNISLLFYGPQSADGGLYATIADYKQTPSQDNQNARSNSGGDCETERPSIPILLGVVFGLVFSGLFCGVWAGVGLDDQWRGARAALVAVAFACSEAGLFFLILTGVYPHTWGLPPQWLPAKWNPCPQGYRQHFPHVQTVSQKVLTWAAFPYYNNYMANILSTDKQIGIIGALCEGSSIRSIERMTGVHRDTIMRLGVRVGQGSATLLDSKMRNLFCEQLQLDEIWGFIGKKQRHLEVGDDPSLGDVWTFCAIDSDTKLVPSFTVGKRDDATANAFVADVAGRITNRVQLSADGLGEYLEAVDLAFGGEADFAQVIKTYVTDPSIRPERRYSAPKIVTSEKRVVSGRPDMSLAGTSYIERLNGTTRLHMRRLTRLTYAFSKKLENFEAAVALHFAYYNLVLRHNTLRCTPAMAAGVEQSFWSLGDLVEATAA
jgi:IS1 family transposase